MVCINTSRLRSKNVRSVLLTINFNKLKPKGVSKQKNNYSAAKLDIHNNTSVLGSRVSIFGFVMHHHCLYFRRHRLDAASVSNAATAVFVHFAASTAIFTARRYRCSFIVDCCMPPSLPLLFLPLPWPLLPLPPLLPPPSVPLRSPLLPLSALTFRSSGTSGGWWY